LRQVVAEPGVLGPVGPAERSLHERALPGSTDRQALAFQPAIGLEHGVRVDRELGDDLLGRGQAIAGLQRAQPQCVLDLMDELQVGGDARAAVETEIDHRSTPFH
jgi:hypothetical protein